MDNTFSVKQSNTDLMDKWLQTPDLTKDFRFVLRTIAETIYNKLIGGQKLDRAYISEIIHNIMVEQISSDPTGTANELWKKYYQNDITSWDFLLKLMENVGYIDFNGEGLDAELLSIALPDNEGVMKRLQVGRDGGLIEMHDICPIKN